MDRQLLGNELRRLRLQANMTLEALAAASGVSVRGIGDLERGLRQPRRSTLKAIAEGLRLEGAARDAFLHAPPARTADVALPPRPPHFTGRDDEIALLMRVVEAGMHRDMPSPVVISGASGYGKTALALEAAYRLSAAATYVDATGFDASQSSLQALLGRLLAQLGATVPAELEGAAKAWQAATSARPPLTILDNVASEAVARYVISAQSSGVVLVTSRRPLQGLEGAARVRVGPISTTDASRLLAQSINTTDTPAITRLAELCDGIPGALLLAVRLIETQGSVDSVIDTLSRPNGRLRALTTPQASMIIGLQNSYGLLSVEAAAVLRTVAEMPAGDITPARIAERTERDAFDVEDTLDELVDYGMLEADSSRYRLLNLVRQFARGIL